MTLVLKRKRGRPTRAEAEARAALKETRSYDDIVKEAQARFELMHRLTHDACENACRALTISGGAGLGKSHDINAILQHHKEKNGIEYTMVKAGISGIGLYMLGYRMQNPNNVILLDDADGIYEDSDALNVLKAMNDSSPERVVSWQKLTNALKSEDIPNTYVFKGAMIFITNVDMQRVIDTGKAKIHEHLKAIMDRSYYLDLKLHTPDELTAWVEYSTRKHGILKTLPVGPLTDKQVETALGWLKENRDDLRSVSIRTAMQIGETLKKHPDSWETDCRILLCR